MKKRKRLTKLISFILSLSLITMSLSFSAGAKAAAPDESRIVSVSDCERLGNYWLDLNYNDGTIIDEVLPITDGEMICSYCVSFIKDGFPNGYIVIDSDWYATNNILEFCFSGTGIYETLCENYGKDVDEKNVDKVIYVTGLFDYAIPVNSDNTVFYNSTNKLFDKQSVEVQCNRIKEIRKESKKLQAESVHACAGLSDSDKESFYGGFFVSATIPTSGGYTSKTITNALSFIPTVMSEYCVTGGFNGNCTPTAAANILNYYRERWGFANIGTSRQDVYDRIVSVSGWNQYGESGMSASEAKKAMKKIVENAKYVFSDTTYLFDLWSDWTRDLDNNYPVLTSVYGYKQDSTGSWTEVGHAIVAVGYREYNSGAKYLRVWDGWNATNNKYIWFDSDYFTSVDGVCIKVTN